TRRSHDYHRRTAAEGDVSASPAAGLSVHSTIDAAAGRRKHGEDRTPICAPPTRVALGWPIEQVVVIDRDLGQSGASAADREGFQPLIRPGGLRRAGLAVVLERY